MINWTAVGPVLVDVVSKLGKLPKESPARWTDAKAGFINPKQKGEVILKIVSDEDIGSGAETRYATPTPGTQSYEVFVGQRRVQLEIRVESQDHSYAGWCRTTADRIRTFINRSSVVDRLSTVNVSVADVGAARDVSYSFDGRRVNAVVFELQLGIGYETTPDKDDSIGVIEHAEVSSELVGVGTPPNFTDVLMP